MATDGSLSSSTVGSSGQAPGGSDALPNGTLLDGLLSVVAPEDVEQVNQTQKNMLNRFEKTNEMLVNVNALGQIHFEKLSKDYRKHTTKLVEMHKDLDWIFHRVRFLKQKLKAKYPDVQYAEPKSSLTEDDDEEATADQGSSDQLPKDTIPEHSAESTKVQTAPEVEQTQLQMQPSTSAASSPSES